MSKDKIHYLNFQFKSEMNVLDLIYRELLESSLKRKNGFCSNCYDMHRSAEYKEMK